MGFIVELPAMHDWLKPTATRTHNRIVKDRVMRPLLEYHWRKRIPEHFVQSAHAKYHYATRDPKYIRSKARRYGSGTDLVKTGATKHAMATVARIRVGGQAMKKVGKTSAPSTGVTGTLELRFPFPGGSRRFRKPQSRQAITIEQMAAEIEAIAADEGAHITHQVRDFYMRALDTDVGARQKIKRTI